MKPAIILWKKLPLKWTSFSPVQRHLKFSAVFGTLFWKSSKVTLPLACSWSSSDPVPISMSK